MVENPESPPQALLAVEVRVGAPTRVAEAEMKNYMVRQSWPIGILVMPEDTFSIGTDTPASILKLSSESASVALDIPDPAQVRSRTFCSALSSG